MHAREAGPRVHRLESLMQRITVHARRLQPSMRAAHDHPLEARAQLGPVERGAGIGFAAGSDAAVTGDEIATQRGIRREQGLDQRRERLVSNEIPAVAVARYTHRCWRIHTKVASK